jgi:isopenicillin N synthase-like dioxygenase
MYIDAKGNEVPCPDPQAGLYARSRKGELIKVGIPSDHLAYQIGETASIHSGGVLHATPHCVRGAVGENAIGVSRSTFAIFMEPMWSEPMTYPEGKTDEDVLSGTTSHLPPSVPSLGKRWNKSQDFGLFTEVTLKSYY